MKHPVILPAVLTLFMALLCAMPGVSTTLELHPHAPEFYTLLTGHFVHYTWRHFFYDGAVFLVLGTIVGTRNLITLTGITTIAVSLLLPVVAPEFTVYRGISAADTALVAFAACNLARDANRFRRIAARLVLAGILLKSGYETVTGECFFVSNEGFAPVAAAHLIGALCGIAIYYFTLLPTGSMGRACSRALRRLRCRKAPGRW